MSKVRFIGLDVHAETIAVAVAEHEGEVRSHGTIPNRLESIRKLFAKVGPAKDMRACYEAGPYVRTIDRSLHIRTTGGNGREIDRLRGT